MVLAALGKRENADGSYSRLSPTECKQVRRQARSIMVWNVVLAVAATAIVYLL